MKKPRILRHVRSWASGGVIEGDDFALFASWSLAEAKIFGARLNLVALSASSQGFDAVTGEQGVANLHSYFLGREIRNI